MKLSHEEESFLRRWVYDEFHYQDGVGPAKRLQLEHHVRPADLAVLIAAVIPDPLEQERAALESPPVEALALPWPWSEEALTTRISEARAVLAELAPVSGG